VVSQFYVPPLQMNDSLTFLYKLNIKNSGRMLQEGSNLHTSTAPLSMRYTTMRQTFTALYFYEEFSQAPDKNLKKHFKQKICKYIFLTSFV
jgi:hypothetical protein